MIKIINEKKQEFGITSGCVSCGENKIEKDIKIIKIIPKYGGAGIEVTLCEECRKKLKELLRQ